MPYIASVFEELRIAIQMAASQWALSLDSEVIGRLLGYFQLLLEWNLRVNLTGATSIDNLVTDHLPDSFALSRFVPVGSDVLDVGSGGGLPALPFSIVRPDCKVTLLEPRAKRVAFLNAAVRGGGFGNVKVVRGRFEDFRAFRFSVATSRATFAPREWLEMGESAIAPGGRLVLLSTEAIGSGTGRLQLIDRAEYRTASGSSRWAGCFCSTWNTPEPD